MRGEEEACWPYRYTISAILKRWEKGRVAPVGEGQRADATAQFASIILCLTTSFQMAGRLASGNAPIHA